MEENRNQETEYTVYAKAKLQKIELNKSRMTSYNRWSTDGIEKKQSAKCKNRISFIQTGKWK